MKRFWTLAVIGLILSILVPLVIIYAPRLLTDSQCSDLYRRYANTPGIQASFVKGFPLTDTLSIDATLLHATDSIAWLQLEKELKLPKPSQQILNAMKEGRNVISTHLTKKGGASQNMDTNIDNNDVVGISYINQSVTIFHTHGINEIMIVGKFNLNNPDNPYKR